MTSPQQKVPVDRGNAVFAIFAFVVLFIAAYQWSMLDLQSLDDMPGQLRDDVFYDNIAYNISERGEFALTFSDAIWLEDYTSNNTDGRYNWIYKLSADGLTTSRPPGFPYILAGCYQLFGREWSNIRLLNMFVLAFGLAFLVATVRRFSGWLAAIITLAIMSADLFVMQTAGQIMTEAIATGIMALMFAALIRTWNHPAEQERPGWRWFLVGVLFGASLLLRSNLVAWLMQLLVLSVFALVYVLVRRRNVIPFLQGFALFLFGCIIVCAPWWARNCRVTGEFAPFGCGRLGMVGGYCNKSFEDRGNWYRPATRALQMEIANRNWEADIDLTLAEFEMVAARESEKRAKKWAMDNAGLMPQMMLMRGQTHLAIHEEVPPHLLVLNVLLFAGALIGMFGSWSRFGNWAALVLFLSLATTMLTWAHEGRYSRPVRPVIAAAAGIGTVYFWTLILGKLATTKNVRKTT